MARTSQDEFDTKGQLLNGFDYENQAWMVDGKYTRCGHPETMKCGCCGRRFAALTAAEIETLSSVEAN